MKKCKETIEKTRGKVGNSDGAGHALQDWNEEQLKGGARHCKRDHIIQQKDKHACIVQAHDFTRKCLEYTLPRNREDHIVEMFQFD